MPKLTILPVLLAATLAAGSATAAEFADPLDTPAVSSALASGELINGLANAGDRIVTVGTRGHILYSDDAGQHWSQAEVPVSSDLTAVSFADARHGWAVGHDGVVLATTDGGATWVKQLGGREVGPLLVDYYAQHAPAGMSEQALTWLRTDAQRFADEGPDKPFLDVWFESDKHGYVIGAFNLILETTDGGATWRPWLHRTENPRAYHLYAIRPVGGELYIAGEQGLLLKLDRETQQFRALTLPYQGTLFGVTGDEAAVIAFGLRGNALRSTDGGESWNPIETNVPVSFTAAQATSSQLYLVSQTGHLLQSSDHGANFSALVLSERMPASAVLTLPDGALLLGGPQGLRRLPRVNPEEAGQ